MAIDYGDAPTGVAKYDVNRTLKGFKALIKIRREEEVHTHSIDPLRKSWRRLPGFPFTCGTSAALR